ncbi:CYTH domain-containing protein [Virgibacillus kimchii]
MAQEVEIEYKNLLTEEEYNQLLYHLPFPSDGETQINYYFETENFSLRSHRSALRIRKKNNTYRLTLKQPRKIGLLETHDTLTEQEAEAMINGDYYPEKEVSQQLANVNILLEDLRYFGSLKTNRREINYEGVLLVLDYSSYNGTEDYELELEAPSEETGKHVFESLLHQYDIPRRDTPNKIERFFKTF